MINRQKWFLAAILLWLLLIWFMSAQVGDASADSSSRFKQWLLSLFAGLPQLQQVLEQVFAVVSIRKIAHFAEYAVLGILSYGFFAEDQKERYRQCAAGWASAFCVAVAAADELHQFHVPGRDGNPSDVLLDTVGALTGILLLKGLNRMIMLRRKQ